MKCVKCHFCAKSSTEIIVFSERNFFIRIYSLFSVGLNPVHGFKVWDFWRVRSLNLIGKPGFGRVRFFQIRAWVEPVSG